MAVLQPVDGPRDLHGPRRIEVFNPATLERLGEIERGPVVAGPVGVPKMVSACGAHDTGILDRFNPKRRLNWNVRV